MHLVYLAKKKTGLNNKQLNIKKKIRQYKFYHPYGMCDNLYLKLW